MPGPSSGDHSTLTCGMISANMTMSTVDRTSPSTPDVYPANRIDKNAVQNTHVVNQANIVLQTIEKGQGQARGRLTVGDGVANEKRAEEPVATLPNW